MGILEDLLQDEEPLAKRGDVLLWEIIQGRMIYSWANNPRNYRHGPITGNYTIVEDGRFLYIVQLGE